MAEHLEGLMGTSMEKVRELVDINTIIGEAITVPDGTVIIPVSKVSFGFVSGGSDIPSASPKNIFGGGAGAGVTIKPQAFIVIKPDGDVRLLEVGTKEGTIIDGIVNGVPDLISKMRDIFGKGKKDGDEEDDDGNQ